MYKNKENNYPMDLTNQSKLNCNYDNLFVNSIGAEHGVSKDDLAKYKPLCEKAFNQLANIRQGAVLEHGEQALFMGLPYQEDKDLDRIISWAANVKENYTTVVSLGIGGSYLGNKTLHEALNHPYYNESEQARKGWPKLYFAGDNLDPARLKALLDVIDIKTTKFLIISKSGGTIEPMSSFAVVIDAIQKVGGSLKDQITAITDESKGLLRSMVDDYGWDSFVVPDGVGGRWSVLSEVGLLTAAVTGIDIKALLEGAKQMDILCQEKDIEKNPACYYALLHFYLNKEKGKNLAVIMPYSNALKSITEWYVQLLAESLGKKLDRLGNIVHAGRTPISALGSTDMHAQTQQHFEGDNSRVLTFIDIANFEENTLLIPDVFSNYEGISFLANKPMEGLLAAACLSNEKSLADAKRPTCHLTLTHLNEYTLGQLLYFFEYATAFEGELLNVNAYDQPGVEAYKKVMKQIIGI